MYRLLVVDDEEVITDSVYYFFKGEEHLDLDVYKAYSAREALELLDKARFDIVISDICMPGMDGLALLDRIKISWPMCHVIFLTGHNNFDYAYHALQYSDVSYILKTEDYSVLLSKVEHAVDVLDSIGKREEIMSSMKRRMDEIQPVIQREFVMKLLQEASADIVQKELDELGGGFSAEKKVLILVGHLDDIADDIPINEQNRIYQLVDMMIEKYVLNEHIKSMMTVWQREMIWLIQPVYDKCGSEANSEEIQRFIDGMLEAVQSQCSAHMNIIISFILSAPVRWKDISDKYLQLRSGLYRLIRINKGVILKESVCLPVDTEPVKNRAGITGDGIGRLQLLLDEGRKEAFFSEFQKITAWMRDIEDISNLSAYETYMSIALVLGKYIIQENRAGEKPSSQALQSLIKMEGCSKWSQALDGLVKALEQVFRQQEVSRNSSSWAIDRLKEYIRSNYYEELSLVKLSEVINFNPSYLSRLFKEVTSMNLQDYILDVRIEKACSMLAGTNMHIKEIALNTGFGSAKYFNTVFKKRKGATPVEWRSSDQ